MNLNDLLPLNGRALHALSKTKTHKLTPERKERLKPFADWMLECISECGPCTDDPIQEFSTAMVTITLLDIMIEEFSKRVV